MIFLGVPENISKYTFAMVTFAWEIFETEKGLLMQYEF